MTDNVERGLIFVVGSMVGAICIKLVEWFKEGWVQKKQREIANLQEQLKSLYGWLHFLVSQNQQCFVMGDNVTQAHIQEYEGREFSVNPESDRTISVSNAYSSLVKDNNALIRKLLAENWHLIDNDDVEVFAGFLGNHTRMNVEAGDDASKRLPPLIRRRLDPIYYMPAVFVERVDGKWKAKRERLDTLRNSWWW